MNEIKSQYIDEIIEYPAAGPVQTSRAGLKVVQKGKKYIAIASELRENPGMSITNSIEYLAWWVVRQYEIPEENLILIEHYFDGSYKNGLEGEEYFDLVTFRSRENGRFYGPTWRRVEKQTVDDVLAI